MSVYIWMCMCVHMYVHMGTHIYEWYENVRGTIWKEKQNLQEEAGRDKKTIENEYGQSTLSIWAKI